MFEAALRVIITICQITTISAILFKIFSPTKIGEKFWNFMQNHKVIGIIYFIMTAVGLFVTFFGAFVTL